MPKTYLLKMLDPSALIWMNREDEDRLRFCGESEEEARRNLFAIEIKAGAPAESILYLDTEHMKCELEYDSSIDGVAGVE